MSSKFVKVITNQSIKYSLYSNKTAIIGDITKSKYPFAVSQCSDVSNKEVIITDIVYDGDDEYVVESLYLQAFYGCNISKLELPNTVKRIGYSAVDINHISSNIILPESLEYIGDWAFSSNYMESWDIPANVRYIGQGVFAHNKNLASISVNDSNQFFTVIDGVLYDYNKKKLIQSPTTVDSVKIPATVTEICAGAFSYSNLTEITFPASVEKIHHDLFAFSNQLKRVIVLGNIKPVERISYFQNVTLEEFQYFGILPITMNIFAKKPEIITVCIGYKSNSLATYNNLNISEYCQAYPMALGNSCIMQSPRFYSSLSYLFLIFLQ